RALNIGSCLREPPARAALAHLRSDLNPQFRRRRRIELSSPELRAGRGRGAATSLHLKQKMLRVASASTSIIPIAVLLGSPILWLTCAAFVIDLHLCHYPLPQRQKLDVCIAACTSEGEHHVAIHQHVDGDKNADTTLTPIQLVSKEESDHISNLVNERSKARWKGDYQKADELRDAIEAILVNIPWSSLPSDVGEETSREHDAGLEYKVVITDLPRAKGGGSEWGLMPIGNPLGDNNSQHNNVLQLAHATLGMAVSASERGVDVDEVLLSDLVCRAEERLRTIKQRKTVGAFFPGVAAQELHGRKAADALLWFALAGISSASIYGDLVDIATEELLRFGQNSSCRAKDVLHIVERVAMAGIIGDAPKRLYDVAADCLEAKMVGLTINSEKDDGGIDYQGTIQSLRDYSFDLHCNRSLLALWRFSSRQRKQRAFFRDAARHFEGKFSLGDRSSELLHLSPSNEGRSDSDRYEWSKMFIDPTRPLVVDVGCGMGVSLLGLASSSSKGNQPASDKSGIPITWSNCNFIGVDLGHLGIRYARGVCDRWALGDRLSFVVDSAEECLQNISSGSYPGKIALIMLQFPTPYRFQDTADDYEDRDSNPSVARKGFNTQLPDGATSDDFMVTEKLLSLTHEVLLRSSGKLLIQSNCEDVGKLLAELKRRWIFHSPHLSSKICIAVHMRNAAEKAGFKSVAFSQHVASLATVTQRAQKWALAGGERAVSQFWSAEPLLPSGGRTETEAACLIDGKPVHRCLLNPR
ncbi:hypothetical protein ACHAWF_006681, partial [Thalassiosira exigua]